MPIHKKARHRNNHWQKQSLWTIAFVVLVGLGASLQLGNGEYFNFSLQSLALVFCFYFMRKTWRLIATGLYLLVGGFGLAVFAGGGSGWEYLIGPSLGFFIGFLAAGIPEPWGTRWSDFFAYSALVHLIILCFGLTSLLFYGWSYQEITGQGMELLPGAILKSIIAASVILAFDRLGVNRSNTG